MNLTDEMIDAPRYLILYAETSGRTIEGAREHVLLSGGSIDCWPDWAKTDTGHLTKAGIAILVWHMMTAAQENAPQEGEGAALRDRLVSLAEDYDAPEPLSQSEAIIDFLHGDEVFDLLSRQPSQGSVCEAHHATKFCTRCNVDSHNNDECELSAKGGNEHAD